TPGVTFTHPVTANIYSVTDCTSPPASPGTPCPDHLLATVTQTLTIPLRPSADNTNCTGSDAGKWFNPVSGKCQNSISVLRTFTGFHDPSDVNTPPATLPDNVIWTVAFNTTHYGAPPIGELVPCFSSSGGCPYDSFNVSAWTFAGAPYAGTDVDPNGAFISSGVAANYCDNSGILDFVAMLRLSTGPAPCGWF